nr:G protein-coupled receptor [Proales similis]
MMASIWLICLAAGLPITFLTLAGNILVILAVMRNRSLQTTTNYFLTSLALTDFLVGLIVMPVSLVNVVYGYFPFGYISCSIWVTLDILLCSCSIQHMCMMSLDRYITIQFPLTYGRNKTHEMMKFKMFIVWSVSIVICGPILILALMSRENVYEPDEKQCAVFNRSFRVYGSIFSFYVPLVIIIVTLASTLKTLNRLMRSKSSNHSNGKSASRESGKTSAGRQPMTTVKSEASPPVQVSANKSETQKRSSSLRPQCDNCTLKRFNSEPSLERFLDLIAKQSGANQKPVDHWGQGEPTENSPDTGYHPVTFRVRRVAKMKLSSQHDKMMSPREEKLLVRAMTATDSSDLIIVHSSLSASFIRPVYTSQANSERKALRVLIMILIAFVALWSPFFLANLLSVYCSSVCAISPDLFLFITWLGYSSSMVNPLIYTMFNRRFRRAFFNLIRCRKENVEIQRLYNYYRSQYKTVAANSCAAVDHKV